MAQDIQTFNQPLPPASERARAKARELQARFTTGISVPFPIMSIKGKTFTLKMGGKEMPFVNQGMPTPIEVIMVNSSPYTNKAFYINGYDGMSTDAPDCWSNDGIYPDASIPAPLKQNPTCNGCRWNKFGTARSNDPGVGGKGKACSDSRRIALAFPQDLIPNQVGPIALRLPVTSLPNLKNFVDYIAQAGFPPNGIVTRMIFDHLAAFPRVMFQFVRPLTEQEEDLSYALEEDERTTRILAAPPEGDAPSVDSATQAQPRYAEAEPINVTPPAGTPPPPLHSAPQPEGHPVTPGVMPQQPTYAPVPEDIVPGPAQAQPQPQAQARPAHLIDLPGGQFYDPIGRFYCDAMGNRLDAAPAPTQAQQPVQAQPATQTWAPPAAAPTYQPGPTPPAAPKRTRKSAAEKAQEAAPAPATAQDTVQQPLPFQHLAQPQQQAPQPMPQPPVQAQPGNGAAQPAPADLENVLSGFVMPPR